MNCQLCKNCTKLYFHVTWAAGGNPKGGFDPKLVVMALKPKAKMALKKN